MSRPIPSSLITDEPLYCLQINALWVEYLIEAVQKLNYSSSWDGDDNAQYSAQQQIEALLNQLKEPCEVSMLYLFNQYGSFTATTAGGNTQNLLQGASLGSTSLPVDFWTVGKTMHISYHGRLVGGSANALMSMSSRFASSTFESFFNLKSTLASITYFINLDIFIYCESIAGSTASLQGSGILSRVPSDSEVAQSYEAFRTNNFSYNNSISQDFSIVGTFNTTPTTAQIISDYCLIEVVAE